MDTVRLARDMGTVSTLFPPGVEVLTDLPHNLFTAIRLALNFLAFEELPEEDQPPKRIWLDRDRLGEWFEKVKKRREEQADPKKNAIEDPKENDLASSLIVGA